MKCLLLLLIISTTAQAIGEDKFAHFGLSYACTLSGANIMVEVYKMNNLEGAIFAFPLCQLVGFIKEMTDSRFDSNDIKANILGGLTAVTFTIPIRLGE